MVTWCARGASPFCYNVGARLATSVGALLFLFPKSYYRVHAPPAVFASLACKVHPARFWKFSFVFNFFLSFKIWKTGERFCSDLFFPHVLKFHFFLFPIELHAPFFVVVVFPPLQFHLVDVELFLLFFFFNGKLATRAAMQLWLRDADLYHFLIRAGGWSYYCCGLPQ